MRSTELGCFKSFSWYLWKALEEKGALAWFHGVGLVVQKFLDIE
jgi:hypothetical protein